MNALSLPLILSEDKRFCNADAISFKYKFLLLNFSLVEAIAKIEALTATPITNAELVEEVKKLAVTLSLSNEYRYYILICGLFSKERNIVKFWTKHE